MVEVEVMHNYDGQEEDELTIRVGDVISDVVKSDGGWWEGVLNGRKGVFPDNFVRERKVIESQPLAKPQVAVQPSMVSSRHNNQVSKTTVSSLDSSKSKVPLRRVRVVYSYDPQNNDELKLSVNDVLDVIADEEEGWLRGVLNGKVGVFPSNFVKEESGEMKHDGDITKEMELKGKKMRSDVFARPVANSNSNSHPVIPTKSHSQPTRPKDFADSKALRIDSEENKSAKAAAVETTTTTSHAPPALPPKLRDSKPNSVERARVVFSYVAENEDELTLNIGDILTVLQKKVEDAGWWKGELKGKIGVFPDNFVELLSVEEKPSVKSSMDRSDTVGSLEKKIERPPLPDPSKVSVTKPLPPKPEHAKVKPQIPAQPQILFPKKTSDANHNASAKPSIEPKKLTVDLKPTGDDVSKTSSKEGVGVTSLDSVGPSQKLVHLTANRVRGPGRRPPTASTLFSQSESNLDKKDPEPQNPVSRPTEPPAAISRPTEPPVAISRPTEPPVGVNRPPPPRSAALHNKPSHPTKAPGAALTPEDKKDVHVAVLPQRLDQNVKSVASPVTPTNASVVDVKGSVAQRSSDPLHSLQTEVFRLKQELEQLKSDHRLRVQQLENEITEERRARKALADEVEKLKKIVFDRLGK